MKQLIYAILLACLTLPVHATERKAVVTFYWPGEDGGRYSCDGARLHEGDAAVDFDYVPKGTRLTLIGSNGIMHVTARDCGGRDVISRKAARERHVHAMVVDVWAPSKRVAMLKESELGMSTVTALYGAIADLWFNPQARKVACRVYSSKSVS